jgi:DNA-directed RNA polymerase specialized sigma24 family protein
MPVTKLTEDQRREITYRFLNGEDANELAKEFGISPKSVYYLKYDALRDPITKFELAERELEFREFVVNNLGHFYPAPEGWD